MKHQTYKKNHLLVIEDKGKFKLFEQKKLHRHYVLRPAPFLPKEQAFIHVYPEHNLLVVRDALYRLDGTLILSEQFESAQIIPLQQNTLILLKSQKNSQTIESALLWNGKDVILTEFPERLLYTERYLAVYRLSRWHIYSTEGILIDLIDESLFRNNNDLQIVGHFLIVNTIGCHDVYSLTEKRFLFFNQQIVRADASDDFVLCLDLQRIAHIYYRGKFSVINNVAYAELIEQAQLFYVQNNEHSCYKVYRYLDTQHALATDADIVSYDEQQHTLIINDTLGLHHYKITPAQMDKKKNSHLILIKEDHH